MQENQDDFNPLLEDFQNDVRKIVLYSTFQLRNYVFLWAESPPPKKKFIFLVINPPNVHFMYSFDLMPYVL